MAHGVVFRVDVELRFLAAAPAFARAYADELAVLFTPEQIPSDIAVQLAARKANLHNVCKAEHVLFAHRTFHGAELGHDDGLRVAAVILADGGHRLAEVFGIQVVRAGVIVAIACMVQVVSVAVKILVVERFRVLFEVVVTDAKRFRTENFRWVCKCTDRIAHSLESLLVACDFATFCGFEQSLFVIGFHVGFVLQADVVGSDSHLFVRLQRGFPPVGEFTIDKLSVRVVA